MPLHTHGDGAYPVVQSVTLRSTANTSNGTSNVLTGFTLVKVLIDISSNALADVPALGTSYGSPYANALLTDATVEDLKTGLSKVTLTYTAQSNSTPPTTFAETSSQTEAPITENANFSTFAQYWDYGNNTWYSYSPKKILNYIAGSSQITKTEYFTSMPSSDRDNIGTIQAPGGPYSGDNNFLLVGSNLRLQGFFWVKESIFLYSPAGWDTDFYNPPS